MVTIYQMWTEATFYKGAKVVYRWYNSFGGNKFYEADYLGPTKKGWARIKYRNLKGTPSYITAVKHSSLTLKLELTPATTAAYLFAKRVVDTMDEQLLHGAGHA